MALNKRTKLKKTFRKGGKIMPAMCSTVRYLRSHRKKQSFKKNCTKNIKNRNIKSSFMNSTRSTKTNSLRKNLQKNNNNKIKKTKKRNVTQENAGQLKRESLKLLKETVFHALSKGLVDISPTGSFQLKLSDKALTDLCQKTHLNLEQKGHLQITLKTADEGQTTSLPNNTYASSIDDKRNKSIRNIKKILRHTVPNQYDNNNNNGNTSRRTKFKRNENSQNINNKTNLKSCNTTLTNKELSIKTNNNGRNNETDEDKRNLNQRTSPRKNVSLCEPPKSYIYNRKNTNKSSDCYTRKNYFDLGSADSTSNNTSSLIQSKMLDYYKMCRQNMRIGKQWTRFLSKVCVSGDNDNNSKALRLRRNESLLAKIEPIFDKRNY